MWNRDTGTHEFHIASWSLWLCAAALTALSTRNPFYLALIILVAVLVGRDITHQPELRAAKSASDTHSQNNSQLATRNSQQALTGLWRVVIIIAFAVAILKGLSYHIGATILFTLPDWLPVIGGPITLEGMVSAALDGVSLMSVLAVFAAFSAGADYYALLRSVPSAMHGAGLVTSIAITFVPQTIQRWSEIREAQSLRGHRVRRIPDLLPLIIPLLAGGMERSMNLAEAMESRGFSRATARSRAIPPIVVQLGLASGLGLVLVGGTMFAFAPDIPLLGWLLILLGLASITATIWGMSKGTKRTRYRRRIWRAHDTPLALISGGIFAILLVFKLLAPTLLAYSPFLRISLPTFDPLVAITICALMAPAIILRLKPTQPQSIPQATQ
ncbi:MAG: energy-coupling factor transporter transmembrane component T [Chloroflexia bacterium]